MADLREKQRKAMPKDVFAYVDSRGEGHLPLNDETHVRNGMAPMEPDRLRVEVRQGDRPSQDRVGGAQARHRDRQG